MAGAVHHVPLLFLGHLPWPKPSQFSRLVGLTSLRPLLTAARQASPSKAYLLLNATLVAAPVYSDFHKELFGASYLGQKGE